MTKKEKSEYDHKWYLANKSYKKTYRRLRGRGLTITADDLVFDRQNQIRRGGWIDERSGERYVGIK